ncbi:hypothetical protein RSW05_11820 [Escherichia coli]|uniref:hypothetical protein n=1 Tax=Escherichia coli TaxID=562 RepID=UPI00092B8977|nr:hypothetical protein [Escherichia coli]MDT8929338.1 hypothetical protein [Escherichia coli]OJP22326.1 hypothetical protein BK336_01330 [Escherichia coli]HDP7078199.1 hypothetical protein [Escherichia coli]
MRGAIFLSAIFLSSSALANGFTVKCGSYTMIANEGELSIINGERVTSQKITELGTDGLKVDMGLMPAKDGNNYGFEYIRRPGTEKRFLNVELLRASMDAPRVIGSFPCKKVPV